MKHAPQQVERAQLLDDPIADFFAFDFLGKGSEDAVPDDEGPGVILVQIARVGRMVDAVMAWRVHDIFDPAREFVNCLGVDPELINEIERADEQQHRGMKTQKCQRYAEDKAKRDKASPCLA
ncbi:MAG: hypothetical protein AN485_22450 [Anabaena sp. MDT14b]|nr:MAG: hypothetical protein AN485_22450 [Anabaena sp. MDT14b]